MSRQMNLCELVEYMAKGLVNDPASVVVTENQTENTSIIELKVNKEDVGKVIGKQGRTAKAMRTILSAASTRQNRRAMLEILE